MNKLVKTVKGIIAENRLKKLNVEDVPFFGLEGKETRARLVHVVDGDTIHVVFPFKTEYFKFRLRMMGINTPELHPKTGTDAEKEAETARAIKARDYLITLLVGTASQNDKTAKETKEYLSTNPVFINIEIKGYDKYGRLLARVFKHNQCINEKMVEAGHAIRYMVKD
jgi:endonuclease YncB( thermonuclease family)